MPAQSTRATARELEGRTSAEGGGTEPRAAGQSRGRRDRGEGGALRAECARCTALTRQTAVALDLALDLGGDDQPVPTHAHAFAPRPATSAGRQGCVQHTAPCRPCLSSLRVDERIDGLDNVHVELVAGVLEPGFPPWDRRHASLGHLGCRPTCNEASPVGEVKAWAKLRPGAG